MKDKRGFTLIELIVILALAGIVMLVVMSFFIANYRSYNRLNTESELQYQSQYIINFMTNKILEASEYEDPNTFNANGNKFKFTVTDEKLIFDDDLTTSGGEAEIGNYIKYLGITHTGNEVVINLILEKDGQPLEASQTVYMRNAP